MIKKKIKLNKTLGLRRIILDEIKVLMYLLKQLEIQKHFNSY